MEIKKFSDFRESKEYPGITFNRNKKVVQSWVNVKVDKDLPLRISRYATSLDKYVDPKDLRAKLEILSSNKFKNYDSQCKLSIVVLLQYLKEIKNNFDPSSSGYLFENFIAGLLHKKNVGGYTSHDFEEDNGTKSQIKFYREKTPNFNVNHKNPVNKYIIGLKSESKADIWIIDETGPFKIKDFIIENRNDNDELIGLQVDIKELKRLRDLGHKMPYTLKFDQVEKIIEKISEGLYTMIENVYENISELNYNIETITTGVDKDGNNVIIDDMDQYYDDAILNMEQIQRDIKDVKKTILSSIKRKKN